MKTVKQLQLLSLAVMLLAVSACQSKPKDGLTDTYTSGVIAIAADESFQLSYRRRWMYLKDCFLWQELCPVM